MSSRGNSGGRRASASGAGGAKSGGKTKASASALPPVTTYSEYRAQSWKSPAVPTKTASTAPHGKALTAALATAENTIRDMKRERSYVISPRGQVVLIRQGNNVRCKFSVPEVQSMVDMVILHNHPVDTTVYQQGGGFSRADVTFAASNQLRESRVVSGDYLYTVRAPRGQFWDSTMSRTLIGPAYDRALAQTKTSLLLQARAGQLTLTEVNLRLYHDVMLAVAKRTGIQYSRTKVR